MTASALLLLSLSLTQLPGPGSVSVVSRGDGGPLVGELTAFLVARARAAWGPAVVGAGTPRFVVEVTATSSIAAEVVVRGEGVALADRGVVLEPLELGLLEAWVLVRGTIEREARVDAAAEPTPEIPPIEAQGVVPVAPAPEAAAPLPEPAAPSRPIAEALHDPRMPGEAILGERSVNALVGPSDRLVDAWGLTLTTQMAGVSRGGMAVHARKILLPRVIGTARVGLEWATPVTGVTSTRLPMTGAVGWIPFEALPLELGGFLTIAPLVVSQDGGGGLGLGAAVGGYARSALRVGPISLVGELGLGAPLARHGYTSAAGDEIATDPPVELRANVGVEWRWP